MMMRISFLSILIFVVLTANFKLSAAEETKYPLGMNLAGINDWSTEFPFLDLTRQARKWIPQMAGKPWGQGGDLDLDDHGWVRSLQPGQSVDLIFITRNGPLPDDEFVVWYRGTGDVSYSGFVRKVRSLGRNRDLVRVLKTGGGRYAILTIKSTDSDDYVRDIHIVPKKFVSIFERGEKFNPDWLRYIRHFDTIRFMDWLNTNGSKIRTWDERPKINDYTWSIKGVPVEIIVDLANEIGSNVWLNIPHMADRDYVRNIARYVSDHLKRNHQIYLEHSNEVWNWRFPQAHYAEKAAERLWGNHGNGYVQWHAKRTVEICSWWLSERPIDDNRLVCVLGVQGGWQDLAKVSLLCPLWEKGPCYRRGINAMAITGYFTGCLDGAAGWKKPSQIERIRKWFSEKDGGMRKAYDQTLNGKYFECSRSVSVMFDTYKKFKQMSDKFGLRLLAYEGGQHITGNGLKIQDDNDFIDFHMKFNRTDYMRKLTLENFQNWKLAGGELFVYFDDVSAPSKWGSWGSMDHLEDDASPKFKAINEFGKRNKRWW